MTIKEAMEVRHTVRKYMDRVIPKEIVAQLAERIAKNNTMYHLDMKLITENSEAFGAVTKLFLAKGVRNYIVLAGDETEDLEEKLGYCGTDLMLYGSNGILSGVDLGIGKYHFEVGAGKENFQWK